MLHGADEVRQFRGFRVGEEYFRVAHFMHLALVHEHQLVAHFTGEAHFVGHHDQGHAVGSQLAHHAEHFVDQLRVQRRGDFVAQQHLGRHRQCAGNRHALLLATGQAIREGVELLAQPDALQHLSRQLCRFGLGHLLHDLRGEHHVLAHAQMREQVELLKHHADLLTQGAQIGACGVQIFAIDLDHTIVDRLQAVERAQQGAFARAAATNDCHDLALFDRQIDAFEYVMIAIVFMQGGNSKQRHAVSFPDGARTATRGSTG